MDLSLLRDINIWSVLLRTLLAVVCGGVIGLERERRRKQAGFRTHILVCLGASLTTLTSQYLFLVQGQYTDIARLGAQVIAGLGFIGAGAIIVTRHMRIKGLTTAAGLWVTGIIGLCCGAGYYEGALVATLLLIFIEFVLAKFEKKYINLSEQVLLHVTFENVSALTAILNLFNDLDLTITGLDVLKDGKDQSGQPAVMLQYLTNKKVNNADVQQAIIELPTVLTVEEIHLNS